MPERANIRIEKDEVTVDDSTLGRLMAGCKGKIKIKTPFGERVISKVKNKKGKVFKDDNHPENVGKVEKPKKK